MICVNCLLPDIAALEAAIVEMVRAVVHPVHAEEPGTPVDWTSADLEDVRQAQHGDADAYRRLVERHQDHVARILWRFSRDRGVHEELVQDVFVEAYLGLSGYRGRAPLDHWLARIATRIGYRYWKERARHKQAEPFDVQEWDQAAEGDRVEQTLEPDQAAELLHRMFEQLAPRDRLVLTLRYLEQCDVVETARRTGWTKTMVKVQTMRARNRLRKLLEQSGTEWTE